MYNVEQNVFFNINEMVGNNRLFCTFSPLEKIDDLVAQLISTYSILNKKIFVLEIKNNNEYALTYNLDQGNINSIPNDTILVHRKKPTNTLYTINALNELIKVLNEGYLDTKYPINWNDYRNQILFIQQGQLKYLYTKIYKIINL